MIPFVHLSNITRIKTFHVSDLKCARISSYESESIVKQKAFCFCFEFPSPHLHFVANVKNIVEYIISFMI